MENHKNKSKKKLNRNNNNNQLKILNKILKKFNLNL